jgi:hypothetical protein
MTAKVVKQETTGMNGDEAVAFAVKQCDVSKHHPGAAG